MKILYLSADPKMSLSDTGGYAVHMTELIRAFREMGNEVLPVVAGHKTNAEGGSPRKRAIRGILPGGTIETARTIWDIWSDYRTYFQAKRALLSYSPDFIYERYAVFHQSGVVLSRKCRVPIILEVNAPIWERDLHYGHRRRTLARKIEKRVLLSGNAIVVVSNFLRNYLLDLGIPGSKIHVIANAADPKTFNPSIDGNLVRRKYQLDDKVVVGFVGGFRRWHGVDVMLSAAFSIIRQFQDIHFLLVGGESVRKRLEEFVRNNGISEYISFTGNVPFDQIPSYIAAMDITVMPNSNSYGSPIKIFEYMAMGKPVIAPKLGPVEEIITDGREGLLINPNIKDELEHSILRLCNDGKLRNEMGINARRTVLEHHTWEKNSERVIQIFLSLS